MFFFFFFFFFYGIGAYVASGVEFLTQGRPEGPSGICVDLLLNELTYDLVFRVWGSWFGA